MVSRIGLVRLPDFKFEVWPLPSQGKFKTRAKRASGENAGVVVFSDTPAFTQPMKFCASRVFWLLAYPRQSHVMLIDAHTRSFAAFW